MSFPLAKLTNETLIPVFNKMELKSFIECRTTTFWLREFVDKCRDEIYLHLESIIIREETIYSNRFAQQRIPKEELPMFRAKRVVFFKISKNRVESMDFSRNPALAVVEVWDLRQDALAALLDKLDKENVPAAIEIHAPVIGSYSAALSKHPILHKAKDVKLQGAFRIPDLAFLCANHGTVSLSVEAISDYLPIVKAIQAIIDGKSSTKHIGIKMFQCRKMRTEDIMDPLNPMFVWSKENHKTSRLKDLDLELMPKRFSFWSLPMTDGKVGGICICSEGTEFRFKVFNTMDEYWERIPLFPEF